MSELAISPQALAHAAQTRDQVDLLKRTICKGATDDELTFFLHLANRTGLDPFARQIYAVKRFNSKTGREDMTTQVGIDGYRLIADRTGNYAGSDDTVFDDEKKPQKATVTVYKMVQGVRCGFTATARWAEYYPGDKMGFMWKKMPCVMLGKVAEALALRKAFPAELSGVYTDAEMEQADHRATLVVPQQPEPEDGNQTPLGYRIPFGQWKNRSIEEVYREHGHDKIAGYIDYIEKQAEKKGVAVDGAAKEFIEHAEAYLGAMENAPREE